jgi:tRNA(His) 5'-end guanylyltransferase
LFDSRVYNLPKEEVTNYFIWRQQDASRNSVQMLGRFYFSQKQMHGKSNSRVQDMLMLEEGVNWNDLSTWMKRGSCVVRTHDQGVVDDNEIPIFTQDRNYTDHHVLTPEQYAVKQAAYQALLQI